MVSNETGSATYILRRPQRVSKRRIVADFGAVGRVSVRFDERDSAHTSRRRCSREGIAIGALRGDLRFDGENGFTRFVARRELAFRQSMVRRRCGGRRTRRPGAVDDFPDAAFLSSCGGEAGAGLFALEYAPEEEPFFLGTRTERTEDLTTIRTLELTGAASAFDVRPDGRSARLDPPYPFSGRAEFSSGALSGNVSAPLPGVGPVRMAPGDAELFLGSVDFEPSKCFPPYFLSDSAPGVDSADVAIAGEAARGQLPRALRRVLRR